MMPKGRWLTVVAVVGVVVLAGCGGRGAGDGAQAKGALAISVTEGGFVPAEVTVPAGQPVTLMVTRRTDRTCATEMVMPAMNIDQKLPLNQAVRVTFTPTRACTLDYACAMDMIKGRVIVK
jgi:plastocyanin domain-containing protein